MARNILILEPSLTMRKILQGMILADISDAVIHEAWTIDEGSAKANTIDCNLILFHLDTSNTQWRSFFEKIRLKDGRLKAPVVLLTTQAEGKFIKEALSLGASESLVIPCGPDKIVEMVNRICNPLALRFTKRYSIVGSSVQIQQRHFVFTGKLVNISKGGLLCEWEWAEGFLWNLPVTVSVAFVMEKETLQVTGLFSCLVSLNVGATYPDNSPKIIRTAFKFINVSEESVKALEEVFAQADREQKLLSA